MQKFIPLALLAGSLIAGARAQAAGPIEIPAVLVKLIDQVEVPAREAGVLAELAAREGARIAEGDVLARIDDTEAQFARQRAKLELDIARKNAANEIAVRSAEKTLKVSEDELRRAQSSVIHQWLAISTAW